MHYRKCGVDRNMRKKEGISLGGFFIVHCSLGHGGEGWVYGASRLEMGMGGCNIYGGSRTPAPCFSFA